MLTCLGVQGFYVFIRAIQTLTTHNNGVVVVRIHAHQPIAAPVLSMGPWAWQRRATVPLRAPACAYTGGPGGSIRLRQDSLLRKGPGLHAR